MLHSTFYQMASVMCGNIILYDVIIPRYSQRLSHEEVPESEISGLR